MQSDSKNAESILKWKGKINFEDGLNLTIEWFKKFVEIYFEPDGLSNL